MKNVSIYLTNEATKITDLLLRTSDDLKDNDLSRIVLLSTEIHGNGIPFSWDMLKYSKNNHPEFYLQDLKKFQRKYVALAVTPTDLERETSRSQWEINTDNELITTPITNMMPINNDNSRRLIKHANVNEEYLKRIISKYEI